MKDLTQSQADYAHAQGLIEEPTIAHLQSHLDQFSPEVQEEFFLAASGGPAGSAGSAGSVEPTD